MNRDTAALLTSAALAGVLILPFTARADSQVYTIIDGRMGKVEHSCTRIINAFTNQDCTFGRTQVSANSVPDNFYGWSGPTRQGGYYALGSAADPPVGSPPTYNPNDANPATTEVFEPDLIKVEPVVVGSVEVDDNGTPASGTDDRVLLTFSIQGPTPTAGIVRSIGTGQSTIAVERWQSLDHTMSAPYPVDQAIPNATGGFDYIIGSRGTPTRLCRALNPKGPNDPSFDPVANNAFDPEDCFPSNNYDKSVSLPPPPAWWAPVPAVASVGIERAPALANRPGASPNVGIQTIGQFRDRTFGVDTAAYSCDSSNQAVDDCLLSAVVWGGGGEDPGFDNLVGVISTAADGSLSAQFYWTQEYNIGAFGGGVATNSYLAGEIRLAATSGPVPDAVPDAFEFADVVGAAAGVEVTSAPVTVSGINVPAPVSVTGGSYSVGCEGAFTSADGTIESGQTVCVRLTSSEAAGGNAVATLAIGGVEGQFSVTTMNFFAGDDEAQANAGSSIDIPILANDEGFDLATAIVDVVTGALNGNVTIVGTGAARVARYVPAPGFAGTDSFEYAVEDGLKFGIATVSVRVISDPDGDGISAEEDNCTAVPNADQRDTDGDGYGNACDADLNNDGRVNFADLSVFRSRFGTTDADADFDGNGIVNFSDLAKFRTLFGGVPGPSGVVP
ncbi:MAG: hypothetical protein JNM50_06880 [Chromatiales bacterium]|nr:hypothetical protein [Chromatiales bacterium]